MTAPVIEIRPATTADLPGVSEVRIRSWQVAYDGLVPASYLASLDPVAEAERMRRRFDRRPGGMRDHLLTVDGVAAAMATVGPYREPDATLTGAGEIAAFYVHPDRWSGGLGRQLMDYTVGVLAEAGLEPVLLWVLETNARARRFYERYGFRPDGTAQTVSIADFTVRELRYRYQ